jgi:protein-disulfide isomerase
MIAEFHERLTHPVNERRDHIRGPVNAPITLVEYGDFECRHCGAAYPNIEVVREQMGDDLRFVYRHYPQAVVHAHAVRAAHAAEAAGRFGQFWEMHDLLLMYQHALDVESLLIYASRLQLDLEQFVHDLTHRKHLARLEDDFLSGTLSGVEGTPAFFINNVRYRGAWNAFALLEALMTAHATRSRVVGR